MSLVRRLLDGGWSIDNSVGAITYFSTDDEGLPRLHTTELSRVDEVLAALDRIELQGSYFAMELSWDNTESVIRFGVNSPKVGQVQISAIHGRHQLAGVEPLTDHNWYIVRLLPLIFKGGWELTSIGWYEAG